MSGGSYYGGKGRWAETINERIGRVGVYVEPFAGTWICGLRREPAPREVMCDLNGFLANFYRAVREDPDGVAFYADWPTIHQDLTARHRWLLRWGETYREVLSDDPEWYDVKAAGWWCWGISSWIGHGWCDNPNRDSMPMYTDASGHGVQMQRTTLPVTHDKRPNLQNGNGRGIGVQIQCEDKRPRVNERGGQGVQAQKEGMPFVNKGHGSRGVAAQRKGTANGRSATIEGMDSGEVLTGERLQPWFRAIAERLSRVIILNRSWESALTPSVLQQTPSSPKPSVGVFLDPPYKTDTGRSTGIYQGDKKGVSDDVAIASYEWAVENGERFRVAYACHVGDFPVPPGWDMETMSFSGHRDEEKRAKQRDCVLFSPACVEQQRRLF